MPRSKGSFQFSQPASYDPSSATLPYPSGQSCTAVTGTMTKAMQAQQVLSHASVHSSVIKVSSSHAGGCVYGVSYPCMQDAIVRKTLSHAGIRVRAYM